MGNKIKKERQEWQQASEQQETVCSLQKIKEQIEHLEDRTLLCISFGRSEC